MSCALCHKPDVACRCGQERGPFALYDRHGGAAGSFVTIDLALACLRVLDAHTKHGPFRPRLIDRHGCPVDVVIE